MNALTFITCGSVDDGKSTLIGRLLLDSKAILSDQLANASNTSHRTDAGQQPDLAAFTDGLQAEREQGITIDVLGVTLQRLHASSSLAIPQAMCNTRATW